MTAAIQCDWQSWLIYGLSIGLIVGIYLGQWSERRKVKEDK